MPKMLLKCVLILGVGACAVALAAAQAPATHRLAQEEPTLHVESNLVLIPVFVYVHNGVERKLKPEVWKCVERDWQAFLAASATEPWFPHDCYDSEIGDLKLEDFRLFQDGRPQQIKSVDRETWCMHVREQPATKQSMFHIETSDTPSGIWSSTEVDGNFRHPASPQFYLLSYAPDAATSEKGCHRLRVEVSRPGAEVFARNEYCEGQTPLDLLNGTKAGGKLERALSEKGQEKIPLYVQAGAIRNGVVQDELADVAVEFPWSLLFRSWDFQTGRLYASIGIMGAVYSRDGKLVARFSDLLWPSWWPTYEQGWQQWAALYYGSSEEPSFGGWMRPFIIASRESEVDWLPTRYETQFALEPGEYTLRVVLSDGYKVGRAEVPLIIENPDDKSLALGSVFLGKRFRDAQVAAAESAAAKIAPQYLPLVSKNIRVIPTGNTEFTADEGLLTYFEIYKPQPGTGAEPGIQAHVRIVDAKSGDLVKGFPPIDTATYELPGSTTIPIARKIPIANLPEGQYRLEVQASDASGRTTPWRAAGFSIK